MKLEPWLIASWPIIQRHEAGDVELVAQLTHLGTSVSSEYDDFGRILGNTIWGTPLSPIGIAWDWTEAHDGVYALADPMAIVSNISFIDVNGGVLTDLKAAVRLNRITHGLQWQQEVRKATRESQTMTSWSQRMQVAGSKRVRRTADSHDVRSRPAPLNSLY